MPTRSYPQVVEIQSAGRHIRPITGTTKLHKRDVRVLRANGHTFFIQLYNTRQCQDIQVSLGHLLEWATLPCTTQAATKKSHTHDFESSLIGQQFCFLWPQTSQKYKSGFIRQCGCSEVLKPTRLVLVAFLSGLRGSNVYLHANTRGLMYESEQP